MGRVSSSIQQKCQIINVKAMIDLEYWQPS